MELTLIMEGAENRRRHTFDYAAWLGARLERSKKIPPFKALYPQPARALPPEEAERERARHAALIERLAPETLKKEPSDVS